MARLWFYAGMNHPVNCLPNSTLSDRFASIIEGLCGVLSAQGARSGVPGPVLLLLWGRMRRMVLRFRVLAAQMRAGTLPAVVTARRRAERRGPTAASSPGLLPRRFGWLVKTMVEYWHVNFWRDGFEEMLGDPEMVAMIAGAPQVGRELRPLCRLLAIKPPPGLALPRRPRKPRVEKPIPENETDAQADARVARMSERAFINMITPETEFLKGRPPHRIGYGRSGPWLSRLPKRS
jgi:hypothetical protein